MDDNRSTVNEDGIETQDADREDEPSKENAIEILEEAPTIRGFGGETRVHPEFVSVECDFCGTLGYLPETTADEASGAGRSFICHRYNNTDINKDE